MSSDYKKLLTLINKNTLLLIDSDNDSGKQIEEEITRRDKEYSDLLESYVRISKIRNVIKEVHKWIFFWLVIVAGIFSLSRAHGVITRILGNDDLSFIVNAIPIIITAFVTSASTIIAIPLAITNFLFNTKEDDNITDIVKHTQEHDATGLDMFKERFSRKRKSPERTHVDADVNETHTDDD